jgi:signal transduction histidine kinase
LEFHLVQIEKSEKYLINFSSSGKSVFLDSNRELVLFRVAQEALHNILKHADASKINVHLHFDLERLQLIIIDNGKGFNTHDHIKMDHIENELNAKSTEERGTGLGNMQKRINLLNGIFTVSSQVGKGTMINIEIPFL